MTHYCELPDYVENSELKQHFIDYLIYYSNNTDKENIYYSLNELLELSDRQWHTYELIDEEVKEQLEKYLTSLINFEDEEIMDYILNIIPRIGLDKLFDYIIKNRNNIKNQNIKLNIDESIAEYGNSVNNPYSGM